MKQKKESKPKEKSHNTEKFWMVFGWVATGIVVYVTVAFIMHTSVEIKTEDLKNIGSLQLNEVGDLFAGIAGSLAMIWLIVTVRLQSIELKAQRKEMAMQREELNTANKHHADQVKQMKLERGLAWQQLKQAEKEFQRTLEQDRKQEHEDRLADICFHLWYKIFPKLNSHSFFEEHYGYGYADQIIKENHFQTVEQAIYSKEYHQSILKISNFYYHIEHETHLSTNKIAIDCYMYQLILELQRQIIKWLENCQKVQCSNITQFAIIKLANMCFSEAKETIQEIIRGDRLFGDEDEVYSIRNKAIFEIDHEHLDKEQHIEYLKVLSEWKKVLHLCNISDNVYQQKLSEFKSAILFCSTPSDKASSPAKSFAAAE